MRTLKAIIDEKGHVELLEPLHLSHKRQALVTILGPEVEVLDPEMLNARAVQPRPFGLCEGEFSVPDDFDAPLPEDVLEDFEDV